MLRRRRIIRPVVPVHGTVFAGGSKQVHPVLVSANGLMQQGQYPEAAETFSRIAEVVRARRGPRAPFFFIMAGRCYMLAGQVDEGMICVRQGLGLLAGNGRWSDLQRFGQVVVDQLTENGLANQAGEISEWLSTTLSGKKVESPVTFKTTTRPVLPLRCPSCGAPVDPREVEWIDQLTVMCLYCESPMRTES